MCDPLIVGGILGGVQAITGIAEQNRQHANQVAAVNRSNAIARQDYLNKIQISAFNDQRKGDVFEAQLKSDAASRAAYYQQKEINQSEATRALTASDQKLRERITEQAFQSQTNLAKAIQAQGTVLASGQQSGQSMLLSLQEAERDFGFKQAQIDATIFDATKNYGIEKYGIDLDQYGANTRALNAITTTAAVAPGASFKTIQPIEKAAPSKPSALGPILGGFSTAISTASAIGGDGYIAERFGWDG
jgi:hypothetical protein